jgi:hypothetical protein
MQAYIPRRDHRFEYIYEAMQYVEQKQCKNCIKRDDDPNYPMCSDVAEFFFAEIVSIPMVEDHGEYGIFCNIFEGDK